MSLAEHVESYIDRHILWILALSSLAGGSFLLAEIGHFDPNPKLIEVTGHVDNWHVKAGGTDATPFTLKEFPNIEFIPAKDHLDSDMRNKVALGSPVVIEVDELQWRTPHHGANPFTNSVVAFSVQSGNITGLAREEGLEIHQESHIIDKIFAGFCFVLGFGLFIYKWRRR